MTPLENICLKLAERAARLGPAEQRRVRLGKPGPLYWHAGHNRWVTRRARSKEQEMDDFLRKINIKSLSDCWIWKAGLSGNGYPEMKTCEGRMRASRFIYQRTIGKIKSGLLACHDCDNPVCVNPMHLFPGTHKSNRDDSVSKGRHAHGIKHGCAKLTESQVLEIRQMKSEGILQVRIAERFNITPTLVLYIIKRRLWKHL